jgi:hypothetical protein
VQVSPTQLITISGTVHGHPAGVASDLQDTLDFAALQGIKPMVEVLPLEKAADGYQRMMANQARFRVVLTTAAWRSSDGLYPTNLRYGTHPNKVAAITSPRVRITG